METVKQLAAAAPVNFDNSTPDWAGVEEVLRLTGVAPADVLAATWCQLSHANIEALVDSPQLVLIHPGGVLATVGKKKMLGGGMKFEGVNFGQVRQFGPTEYTDERGFGKFCVEFAAAGSMLLGRLQWAWRGKRFRNNRDEVIAVAEERDRILGVVSSVLN